MFKTGDILNQRYLLKQPLETSQNGRQTWLAIDLGSHEFGLFWRWEKLNNIDWLNSLKLFFFQRSPQYVTIKLLAFSPQLQWSEFKLFEREAEVLQTLNHERIPRYHASFEIESKQTSGVTWFAIAQEYLAGWSLAELLNQNKTFNQKEIKKIAQEILEILIYLHEQDPPILHRDIKPSNLILGNDGHIYLIDFGAVQTQKNVTGVTFTVVGTNGYAPLEQYWGKAVPASDLYGLGATLIHLLIGTLPEDLMPQLSSIQSDHKKRIDPVLKQWLERLTHSLPEKRYQSAREALIALFRIDAPLTFGQKVIQQTQKIIKPKQTQIKLLQSSESLDLQIASGQSFFWKNLFLSRLKIPKNPTFNFSRLGVLALSIWSFLIVPSLMVLTYFLSTEKSLLFWEVQLICALNFLIVLLIYLIDLIIWSSEKTQLSLQADGYQLCKTFLGITYYKKQGKFQDIIGVFPQLNPENCQVTLNTQEQIYWLGKKLEPSEALWLTEEIKQWLYDRPE